MRAWLSVAVARVAMAGLAPAVTLLGAGCEPASAPTSSIAAVHQHQCGRCHSPPPPGSHTRARLVQALSRHRSRVRLSGEQWAAMVDYLAAPDSAAVRAAP